jgi:hypothetical protein
MYTHPSRNTRAHIDAQEVINIGILHHEQLGGDVIIGDRTMHKAPSGV